MKQVYLIEDQDEIRNGLVFLINVGKIFQCTGFDSAETALDAIREKVPDVVLMDINLPGIDGIECTRIIKNHYPEIQIMMVTVYEDDEKIFSALKAGASGYILKNSAPEKMIEQITDLSKGGSPMSSQIARKVVTTFHIEKPADPNYVALSQREKEILNLLADGFRNKEIAEKIFISAHTVRTHIYNIYQKLHVQTRIEAIKKISTNGNNGN